MADELTYREKPKPIHPAGTYAAKCVDFIDLGECVIEFPGSESYVGQKCRFVWYTGILNPDTQKPFEVGVEYTVSLGDRANLRKMLESWKGEALTPQAIEKGVPFHLLVGKWCQLSITHKQSKQGRTFANVLSVTALHPDIRKPELPEYARDKYWGKVKEEYTKKVATFRHQDTAFAQQFADDIPDGPEPGDESDGLPW